LSVKRRLAPLVHSVAWRAGLTTFAARAVSGPRILMFHAVGGDAFPEDELDARVAWLARRFEVVPLARLLDPDVPARRARRFLALTFDDGLASHARVAAPVLSRHGAPATFFVCPDLARTGRWVWTHEVRARWTVLPAPEARELATGWGAASCDAEAVLDRLKALGPEARARAEDALRARTAAFAPTPAQRAAHEPMDVAAVAALDPALFAVGSHTSTHPILTTLPDEDLRREVVGSRRGLEDVLGRPVDLFCYPNGSQDARVRAAVAASYRAAVATRPGLVRSPLDPHALPRIPAEPPAALLAWRLVRPAA
jgi:peptidoglycan/xylan/chitin deacetylase (PgdA/CDA1 family)